MMGVMEPTSLRFARCARALEAVARAEGLRAPTFRSPPRLAGVSRSIVRRGPGVVVAVALRDRPWAAVVADMVEGVVAANRLSGLRADRARRALWAAVPDAGDRAA
jgi:hypothetical protein